MLRPERPFTGVPGVEVVLSDEMELCLDTCQILEVLGLELLLLGRLQCWVCMLWRENHLVEVEASQADH